MSNLVLNRPEYKSWEKKLKSNGVDIKNITVIGEVSRDQESIFATLIDCTLTTSEGISLPRLLILQSDGIMVIPVLNCVDDQTIYTLMVEQRRIVDGGISTEFPAGSVNALEEDPYHSAIQEIEEELGISISKAELNLLTQEPIISCSVFSSSVTYYFYFEKSVTKSFLLEMDGLETGCYHEQEHIKVKVKKMSEVASGNVNAFCLAGIKLLEKRFRKTFD